MVHTRLTVDIHIVETVILYVERHILRLSLFFITDNYIIF